MRRVPDATLASVVLCLVLLAAGVSQARADGTKDPGVTLARTSQVTIKRTGDWVTFDYPSKMKNATIRTILGTSDGSNGCEFSGYDSLGPEELSSGQVVHEREVATNLTSCVMRVEKGLVSSETPTIEEGQQAATETTKDIEENRERGKVPYKSLRATTRTAWHKTMYKDPPGIVVNSSKAWVTWSYSGGQVRSSSGHKADLTWFIGSGWSRTASNVTSSRNSVYAITRSNSSFQNRLFCNPLAVTDTSYKPNEIRGNVNGGSQMYWVQKKSGDCSSLLSFAREYGYA